MEIKGVKGRAKITWKEVISKDLGINANLAKNGTNKEGKDSDRWYWLVGNRI